MGIIERTCLFGATFASGVLCTTGIVELFVSLFFLSHLHPMHLLLQMLAGIWALISGVIGIVFSRKLSGTERPIRPLGIRVTLVVNGFIQFAALTLLLLDRAGYANFLKKVFPMYVSPQWTHTSMFLSKGVLALSCADSLAMLMSMLIWICTLTCFVLDAQNLSNITVTSARWVWKGNDTTTFRSPVSSISTGIASKKSKWMTREPNATIESSNDVPDCRPKRKGSFKSYSANKFQNKTGRTPICRMSSFRPLTEIKRSENTYMHNCSLYDHVSFPGCSTLSNSSTASRRSPKKVPLPSTPPLRPVTSVKTSVYKNYISPDYVPYRQNPLLDPGICISTPNYVPFIPLVPHSSDELRSKV